MICNNSFILVFYVYRFFDHLQPVRRQVEDFFSTELDTKTEPDGHGLAEKNVQGGI